MKLFFKVIMQAIVDTFRAVKQRLRRDRQRDTEADRIDEDDTDRALDRLFHYARVHHPPRHFQRLIRKELAELRRTEAEAKP